jgi:cytochrome c oxidase assembly factor CtaG
VLAAAAATPGLGSWYFDPAAALLLASGALYWIGGRRTVTPTRLARSQRVRSAAFYVSLATVFLALDSPIEDYSKELFWVHMIQHVLLMLVAAPLLVFSCPWIRLFRALPLSWRRWLARGLAQGERTAPLRSLARFLGRPVTSLVLWSVVLLGWHVPVMFNATLHSEWLHVLEHTLFFSTSVLLFKQVIPSAPLRASLAAPQRVVYSIVAMIVSWALAVILALSPKPLYPYYAHLTSRPGGISALADQQLAAGIMWVPGSITFLLIVFVYVHRWLAQPEPGPNRAPRLAGEH